MLWAKAISRVSIFRARASLANSVKASSFVGRQSTTIFAFSTPQNAVDIFQAAGGDQRQQAYGVLCNCGYIVSVTEHRRGMVGVGCE